MRALRRIAGAGLLTALVACGGGRSLAGPFLIDFEDRPDDGFSVVPVPVVIGPGVTITDVSPAATLEDFSTADGWGLIPCDATAFSGTLMMGCDASPGTITITFARPVSRVQVYAGGSEGTAVDLEAFDGLGVSLGLLDSQLGACPSLNADDLRVVDAGSNRIVSVEIRGNSLAIDDLSYWYFN